MWNDASRHSPIFLTVSTLCLLASPSYAQFQGAQTWQVDGLSGPAKIRNVTVLGDVNGDGFEDVAVCTDQLLVAPGKTGQIIVRSGLDGSALYQVDAPLPNTVLWGRRAKPIADANGDGTTDFLVVGEDGQGYASLHSGTDGVLLGVLRASGPLGATLTDATGIDDVNGDGVADFLVGVPPTFLGGTGPDGKAVVLSGATLAELYTMNGPGGELNDFGRTVYALGDLDGDGVGDLAIQSAGGLKLHSGVSGTLIRSLSAYDHGSDKVVAPTEDLNGDGVSDILVGYETDSTAGTTFGKATLYSGSDGAVLHNWFGSEQGSRFGERVAVADDFNGDGVNDLIISASNAGVDGEVHVFSGADFGLLVKLFADPSTESNRLFGEYMDASGDLDGDGFSDVVVSDPSINGVGAAVGRAMVFVGAADPVSPYCGSNANSTGSVAHITVQGTTSLASNDLGLQATPVPNTPGLFFFGQGTASTPFGDGIRCVGGMLRRLPVSVATGHLLSNQVDSGTPQLNGLFTPGSTWNFQGWFRDQAAGGAGFNTSDAVHVQFLH